MVKRTADMPPGTLGFRIAWPLTREDYLDVLVPPLQRAVQAGEQLRVLYEIPAGLHMEPGALWEDLKVELDLGIKHRDAWKQIAVVSDVDWLRHAFQLFAWMVPGEMRLFGESELEQAKAWLAS